MRVSLRRAMNVTRAKGVQAVPCIFTLLNAFFGFLSIIKILDGDLPSAAYCIITAACMDMLDGRIARAFNVSSYFGMELDSLCDVVSFCLAPCILLYQWKLASFGIVGLLVLGLYLSAGIYRLARFNVSSGGCSRHFSGLPVPIPAFLWADLVLRSSWLSGSGLGFLLNNHVVALLVLVMAVLMISSVPYFSFKYHAARSSLTYAMILATVLCFFVCTALGYPFFLLATLLYIVAGIIGALLSLQC